MDANTMSFGFETPMTDGMLTDYLLNDLEDDPAGDLYATVSASGSEHGDRGKSPPKGDDASGGSAEPAPAAKRRKAADGPASPRAKTQAQIDRRRDRNRILARRTRLRKKFFFESLQQQVNEVERENALLKELVRTTPALAEGSDEVLATCTTALPAVVTENRRQATDLLNASDFTLMQTLQSAQRSFCISDPSLPDNPIVYASASFLTTTGYSMDEVIGKNCRFLQGPATDPNAVADLKKGVASGEDTTVTILNYKKDGTPFWNQLFVASLRDINKRVVNYVGVQIPVAGPLPKPGDPPKPYPPKADTVKPEK
mmetsp:Transcript_22235/g.66755  ORF Transcript_22235/g.66755 Transcript_22235/m.66755 type:complete len:314 (+) Transcript_22235:198-1139(+)